MPRRSRRPRQRRLSRGRSRRRRTRPSEQRRKRQFARVPEHFAGGAVDPLDAADVDEVILGQILAAGQGLREENYAYNTKSTSAFGQIDFHVNDKLTLTAGMRYTKESKDREGDANLLIGALVSPFVPPVVTVTTSLVGASPETIEDFELRKVRGKFLRSWQRRRRGCTRAVLRSSGQPGKQALWAKSLRCALRQRHTTVRAFFGTGWRWRIKVHTFY
mgnify:CR=1 FL=1